MVGGTPSWFGNQFDSVIRLRFIGLQLRTWVHGTGFTRHKRIAWLRFVTRCLIEADTAAPRSR